MAITSTKPTRIIATIFVVAGGYFLADLLIIQTRGSMLPAAAPVTKNKPNINGVNVDTAMTQKIVSRNLFALDGKIPEPLANRPELRKKRKETPPVPTQLPLALLGTLVHSSTEKSIASIDLKGKNKSLAYHVGQEIDGLAQVEKIERFKVFIRNLSSGALEFIEMKNDSKLTLKTVGGSSPKSEVKQISENDFEIKRDDLLKYTANISDVIMQARVIPERDPGGNVIGYRMADIQPGSIYEKLGLKVGDSIRGVNGTPVTSPQQAMELFNALKSADKISLSINRDGQTATKNYNVR